jgi:hypothetical protein
MAIIILAISWFPAVYEGAYEEKHERRWELAACPVSGRMFPLSPILVAGNSWEIINELVCVKHLPLKGR